jgi:MFS family permease
LFWKPPKKKFANELFLSPSAAPLARIQPSDKKFDPHDLAGIWTRNSSRLGYGGGGTCADCGDRGFGVAAILGTFLGTKLYEWTGSWESAFYASAALAMVAGLTVPALRVYGPELFPTRLRGMHPDNPVNRVTDGGVQLELPPRIRRPGADFDALVSALAAGARRRCSGEG